MTKPTMQLALAAAGGAVAGALLSRFVCRSAPTKSQSPSEPVYGMDTIVKYLHMRDLELPAVSCEDLRDSDVVRKLFLKAYPQMRDSFLCFMEGEYHLDRAHLERLRHMMDYTTIGGKLNRGISVVLGTAELCDEGFARYSDDLLRRAIVLGWCIELLQAHFLVADDLMDGSETRRGAPCWYKREDVKYDAVNDALILESFLHFLLKLHLFDHPQYASFVEMYREVSLQTQLGQMLDLLGQPQGRKGPEVLAKFTERLYEQIIEFKTAYYTIFVPAASAMILCGLSSKERLDKAREIAVKIGIKFQIQDDYLDCYADPAVLGKVGTDIADHKCSWLVVQAKKRCSPEQLRVLEENLGKEDQKSQQRVKDLYNELELPSVYDEQEEVSYRQIDALITANATIVPECIFRWILKKIHRREK